MSDRDLTTRLAQFETRLGARLQAHAAVLVTPIDAREAARAAIAAGRRRGMWPAWLTGSPGRRSLTPVLVGLLLLALLAGAAVIGAYVLQTMRPPVRPLIIESTGSTTVGRTWHAATLLSDGRVFVTGGFWQRLATPVEYPKTAEIYDPMTGTFTQADRMSVDREHPVSVLLADGLVLVAGGAQGHSVDVHQSAILFDPRTGTFTETSPLVARRVGAEAILLTDGRVLIAGGDSDQEHQLPGSAGPLPVTAEVFDPQAGVNGSFAPVAGLTEALANFNGVVGTRLASGELLLASVTLRREDAALAAPLLLDQQLGATELPLLPVINGASASEINRVVALPDGTAIVVAGYGPESWHFLRFNPADATYDDVAALPAPPVAPVVVLADGRVAALVGDVHTCSALTAEIFDPSAREFERAGTLPAGRACEGMSPTLTPLKDGGALVVGGRDPVAAGGSDAVDLIHSPGSNQ